MYSAIAFVSFPTEFTSYHLPCSVNMTGGSFILSSANNDGIDYNGNVNLIGGIAAISSVNNRESVKTHDPKKRTLQACASLEIRHRLADHARRLKTQELQHPLIFLRRVLVYSIDAGFKQLCLSPRLRSCWSWDRKICGSER